MHIYILCIYTYIHIYIYIFIFYAYIHTYIYTYTYSYSNRICVLSSGGPLGAPDHIDEDRLLNIMPRHDGVLKTPKKPGACHPLTEFDLVVLESFSPLIRIAMSWTAQASRQVYFKRCRQSCNANI